MVLPILAFRYYLKPHVLRDVSHVNTEVDIIGGQLSYPLGASPTSLQCLFHPDGELATARGTYLSMTICTNLINSLNLSLRQ